MLRGFDPPCETAGLAYPLVVATFESWSTGHPLRATFSTQT